MRRALIASVLTVAALVPALGARFYPQSGHRSERADYLSPTFAPADPATKLNARLATGKTALKYEARFGYLRSLLRALGISSSSQMLVFSRTSLQTEWIRPASPRALYFDDQTYVGWIYGAKFIEIASMDPVHGAVLYVLRNEPDEKPELIRQTFACLSCHGGTMTGGVPGVLMRSVYPARDGQPAPERASYLTTDASPFAERWGGWYVTGTHGKQRHLGNAFVTGGALDPESGANVTDLNRFFETENYLTPHSDIVALTVAAHQMRVQNLLTLASQALRRDPSPDNVKTVCEPIVEALCGSREPPLTDPIAGTSRFAVRYAASGPKDSKGRSLRELDLSVRLFRYEVSQMVYSPAIRALPVEARTYLFQRLRMVCLGKPADEILLETLPGYRK